MSDYIVRFKFYHGGEWRFDESIMQSKYYGGKEFILSMDPNCSTYMDFCSDISQIFSCGTYQFLKLSYKVQNQHNSYLPLNSDESFMDMIRDCSQEQFIEVFCDLEDFANLPPNIQPSNLPSDSFLVDNLNEEPLWEPPLGNLFSDHWDFMSDSDEETSNELTSDDEDDPSELDKIPENDNGEYDMELYDNEGETYKKNGCMHPSLNTGDTFESVYKFREALREFAVVKKYELYFVKNDTKRVRVVCKNSSCNWTLHASLLQDNHTFEVKTIKGKHNCEVVGVRGNRMANTKWVCNKIFGWVRDEPTIGAKCLRKRVKNTHRVNLSYHKVWRGKEMALEKLYRNVEESFKLVPSLQWELKERNPSSVIEYNANPNTGAFERFFMCFKACIDGFNNGCRRILFLDGCHLRGKYQDTLLAATTLDGNFGIFPVAFAIVESESGHSWKWFLDCLVSGIGPCDGMTFMSDRLRSLDTALNLAFSRSEHRVCKRHFYGNFAKKYTGLVYQKIITKAAFAYHPDVFDSLMEELKDKSQAAHGWIDQQTEKVWTRSKFGFHAKCHYVTNNPAESFNKILLEDRCRPMLI